LPFIQKERFKLRLSGRMQTYQREDDSEKLHCQKRKTAGAETPGGNAGKTGIDGGKSKLKEKVSTWQRVKE